MAIGDSVTPKRIGLVRHFEVKCPLPSGWFTCAQFMDWRERYDLAEVTPLPVDLGTVPWDVCLSSDLPRAFATAQAAFMGEIQVRPDLREIETLPFQTGNLRLPLPVWRWIYRFAWMSNHQSQNPAKVNFFQRLTRIKDELLSESRQNILVVSHAGTMIFLRKELIRLGFKGPKFNVPNNGQLYVFEKAV